MAVMTTTIAMRAAMASPSRQLLMYFGYSSSGGVRIIPKRQAAICRVMGCLRRPLVKPLYATGPGLEASVADDESLISVRNANVTVESQDAEKIQVRVDVSKEATRIVFEKVLRNLARSAPPVPGFRREKGGKTSKVPTDFLLQMLGEDRVTNFVIREIVTSILADYVKQENLSVKDNKISTTQTPEELKSSFTPGTDFGFNATLELEK